MLVKEIVKAFSPSDFYQTLNLWFRYPGLWLFKKRLANLDGNNVILAGTVLHRNLGDHLIAQAEKEFLAATFPGKTVFEIPVEVFVKYKEFISENVREDVDVCITGGGWMGSLWADDERVMQDMIRAFSGNRLTILPQTIYYENDSEEGKNLLESANELLGKCRDVRLCTRDEASYEFAVRRMNIPKANILLAPDMGLYYTDTTDEVFPFHSAGMYLRSDRERISTAQVVRAIRYALRMNGYSSTQGDTMNPTRIPIWQREEMIKATILKMKKSRIIVTDRLHAMIYAVIAGRKCIVLDNLTGKVGGVYRKWLKWDKNILYLDNTDDEEVVERISAFLHTDEEERSYSSVLLSEFRKLQTFVRRETAAEEEKNRGEEETSDGKAQENDPVSDPE